MLKCQKFDIGTDIECHGIMYQYPSLIQIINYMKHYYGAMFW